MISKIISVKPNVLASTKKSKQAKQVSSSASNSITSLPKLSAASYGVTFGGFGFVDDEAYELKRIQVGKIIKNADPYNPKKFLTDLIDNCIGSYRTLEIGSSRGPDDLSANPKLMRFFNERLNFPVDGKLLDHKDHTYMVYPRWSIGEKTSKITGIGFKRLDAFDKF